MKSNTISRKLINAPYILWASIFVIVPMIIVVYYAFTDASGAFSVENIKELSNYSEIIYTSIWYSLVATAITLVMAYPFAYFMTKCSANMQRMQMLLVMLPMWMNLLIRTYSWMNILEKNGIINNLLVNIGLEPIKFLGTPGAVIFGMIYNYLPYMILPIYTIMAKLDTSLLDAASDLGCNGVQKLRKVILPLSMPGVISGIAMVFVPSVSTFYISQKLGNGKIMLIGDTIERFIKSQNNYNMGASLSLILMVLILVSMTIVNKFADGEEDLIV